MIRRTIFFFIIEDRKCIHFSLASNKISASTCIEDILCNNNLLFEWCIIAAEVEEEVSKLVLQSAWMYANRHTKKQCQRQEICKVNFALSSDYSIHDMYLCKCICMSDILFHQFSFIYLVWAV